MTRTNRETCRGGFQTRPCFGRRRSPNIVRVIRPPRRIIRDVIANAIQCFLVANDVLVAAALPHDATLAGTFIDAASGECFEATHDFRNGVARFRLIGESDNEGAGFETRPYMYQIGA